MLGEQLHEAGYMNGIFAKVPHIAPVERMRWDTIVQAPDLGQGRDPKRYYEHAKAFFEEAKKQNKPFFLMANSQDPHRPWPGSEAEVKLNSGGEATPRRQRRAAAAQEGRFPGVSRTYSEGEVPIPGFLPDLPEVRKEMAQYYTSAHRCDEALGEVLRALKETGFEDNTLVMFLSDNGISQPFAKSNVYFTSNKTPWLVKWPGKIKPGQVDETNFISGIDFMPTILEAAGLKSVNGMDGRSFLPLTRGESQPHRDSAVTVYHITSGKREYLMRCVSNKDFTYIYNAWSDGKTAYQSEPMGGQSFQAMKRVATSNPAIAARVEMLIHRVPEEFYDLHVDPDALHNLIGDAQHAEQIKSMKQHLAKWMEQTKDPLLDAFKARVH
jgi:N-sulfoglucosamine sulfohydrolase